ncbi:MAG: hypothetical protein OMM_08643 [Candidatus Magnetoglobus multicellularis str. Araruama]|uniref:Lipoprotein n=1 Tax=Candidatus Magnetoglobus multicellularis str. Araruama TaxID=890399 RepID=A0A1V1P7B1_9BACT|nr:MAG: hypothetical protein OMM_08643 [Candidatus Magnetoglobus multicellularis str. Araruama]
MLKKLITIIMLLSFVGCGHYLIETEPFPQKKSIPRQTVKKSPQKAVEKKQLTEHKIRLTQKFKQQILYYLKVNIIWRITNTWKYCAWIHRIFQQEWVCQNAI